MGDDGRNDAYSRRDMAGWLTGAALTPAFAAPGLILPSRARAQPAVAIDPVASDPSGATVKAAQDLSQRMTVPVMLNGQGPFPFVVDTGSNRTVVSDTLAQQLGLPAGRLIQVSSATGMATAPSAHIAKLVVGGREIADLQAPVLMAGNLGAAGMLGIDAVADQTLVMDFKLWEMRIQPSSRVHEDAADVVVKAKSRYGQLLLVDSWVDGIALYVIIDTGGEMTIGNLKLRQTLLRRTLPLHRASSPDPVEVTSVIGGKVQADLAVMPRVSIGHIWVDNLQVAYADLYAFTQFGLQDKPAMLLGMSTLRQFRRVWVDFKARQVRFLLADQARTTSPPVFAKGSAADPNL